MEFMTSLHGATGPPNPPEGDAPRILYYCHDTFGLGHLRRTLALAAHARSQVPRLSQLIVTGSPVASAFPLPPGCDFVKLPAVVKKGAGEYAARTLDVEFDEVSQLRSDILLASVRVFEPDVMVVDHTPTGLKGEVIAALLWLHQSAPRARLVLGLRDIIDEPGSVKRDWLRDGVHHMLDHVYDRVLIYGDQDVFDPIAAYGMSSVAAAKSEFVGYLGREPGIPSVQRWRRSDAEKLVVVTAGGGGDGAPLLRAAAEALGRGAMAERVTAVLVTGPLMEDHARAELTAYVAGRPNLHLLTFADDLPGLMRSADAIIAMGGYNTVCELLSLGRPTLVVPRVHPRREQLIRAEALASRALLRMLHPDHLTARRLRREVATLLGDGPQALPARSVPLNGLANAASALERLLFIDRAALSLLPIQTLPDSVRHAYANG